MTNQEILTKAIQKAIDGGWVVPYTYRVEDDFGVWAEIEPSKEYNSKIVFYQSREQVIFNQYFATSLWGEDDEIVWADDQCMEVLPAYKYHLQRMVIADDPIQYLAENI